MGLLKGCIASLQTGLEKLTDEVKRTLLEILDTESVDYVEILWWRLQCAVRNVQPRRLQPQLPSTLPEPRFVPRLPSNYKAGPTEPQNITAVLKDAGSEWLPANKEHWPASCFCDEQVSAIEAAAKGKAGNHGEPVPSCMHPHL